MVAGKSQPPGLGGAKMDKFKEQDSFLYYKNEYLSGAVCPGDVLSGAV